jgi:hypothetical protein
MRFGIAASVAGIVAAIAGALVAGRLLAEPEGAGHADLERAAGLGVQQAIAEVVLRSSRLSTRTDPILLAEDELNAFLARHFEARRLPFRPIRVRAGAGWLDVMGHSSLRRLAEASALGALSVVIPDLGLWLSVRGRLAVTAGTARLTIERARIGEQPVPPSWVWTLARIDPERLLAWRLPPGVEGIASEPGRLVIHTRAGR